MKRAAGLGSVTPKGARFWARSPRLPDGSRPSLGVYDTWDEADEVRAAAVNRLADADLTHMAGVALRAFGERWLAEREADGDRSTAHRKARWGHILGASFIDDPIATIGGSLVAAFVRELQKKKVARGRGPGAKLRTISRRTVRVIVGQLGQIFAAAVAEGLCGANPCAGTRIRGVKDEDAADVWTYLDPAEQRAVTMCVEIPEADRLTIAFAIGTGLRLGEMTNLELHDLVVTGASPHIVVRWGSKGKRPKNGKIRIVPLFGDGLEAARRWLKLLPSFAPKNPHGLVFPTARGFRRRPSQHLQRGTGNRINGYHLALRAAGITRPVRWHDLRHTCASSLVAGWWGPVWRLEEARDVLGHTSIRITERYAHLAPAVVADLASRTGGLPRGLRVGDGRPAPANDLPMVPRMDRASEAAQFSGSCCSTTSPAVPDTSAPGHPSVTHAAFSGLMAMVRRDLGAAWAAADWIIDAHPVARAAVALRDGAPDEEARLVELFEAVREPEAAANDARAEAATAAAVLPMARTGPGLARARAPRVPELEADAEGNR